MQAAIVGLGRMGKNIALHLLDEGVGVVAYNRSRDDIDELVKKGAYGAYTLSEIPEKLTDQPNVVLLFVPAGKAVDEILFGARGNSSGLKEFDTQKTVVQKGLVDILPTGSIIIDGGNSFYQDSQKRFQILKSRGMHFLDMGTSGGVDGARLGACLMLGGDQKIYEQVVPLLAKIATPDGFGYIGMSGAGHFVKMVHNAIEYGMMGSLAEGFNLVKGSVFDVDLAKLAKIWAHGSIINGLLAGYAESAFQKDPQLSEVAGEVPRGETEAEMEWLSTIGIPHPVIETAIKQRKDTRKNPSFIGKVIAALRREFGGHSVKLE